MHSVADIMESVAVVPPQPADVRLGTIVAISVCAGFLFGVFAMEIWDLLHRHALGPRAMDKIACCLSMGP